MGPNVGTETVPPPPTLSAWSPRAPSAFTRWRRSAAASATKAATNAYWESSYIVVSLGGGSPALCPSQGGCNPLPQPAELRLQRHVPLSGHAYSHLGRTVVPPLDQRPQAAVGEGEEHDQADYHEGAGDPDDIGSGVLHHLQAGKTALSGKGEVESRNLLCRPPSDVFFGDN